MFNASRLIAAKAYRKLALLGRRVGLASRARRLAARVPGASQARQRAGVTRLEAFGLEPAAVEEIRRGLAASGEVRIARIDHDGRLLSGFGPIRGASETTAADFLERERFSLDVVALAEDEAIGVRKNFRGDRAAFLLELEALIELGAAGLDVPAVLDVDVDAPAIVMTFLAGQVLREALALRGAVVRDVDVARDPRFAGLPKALQRLRRIEEGRRVLPEVVGPLFIEQLFELLSAIHARGFLVQDIKYGNVIIAPDGKPRWLDFDKTARYPWAPSWLFRALRGQEIEEFNLHYGTAKPTGFPA